MQNSTSHLNESSILSALSVNILIHEYMRVYVRVRVRVRVRACVMVCKLNTIDGVNDVARDS